MSSYAIVALLIFIWLICSESSCVVEIRDA